MSSLLFFLLPAAAAVGWYAGYKQQHHHTAPFNKKRPLKPFSRDYFLGLNYLINEEPDKAIDVFIKTLEVNDETVETHLALGSLFRRRGEVDRAIRVHQNIIARADLEKEQKVHALSELGLDYLRAGLLDRAEKLFLELVNMGAEVSPSYHYLLNIYQLQKEWQKAIQIAKKLAQLVPKGNNATNIGHYYCELAQVARKKQDFVLTKEYLGKALASDKNSARASIILGDLARHEKQFETAIELYQQVKQQDPRYLSEIVAPLADCYNKQGNFNDFISFFSSCLAEYPHSPVLIAVTDALEKTRGIEVASEFLITELNRNLSLRGIAQLLTMYQNGLPEAAQTKLQLVKNFVTKLLEKRPNYRCGKCGFAAKALYWQCPSCKNWSTMALVEEGGSD